MNDNFDKIRKEGRLLYEYVRGSTLYKLNTPDSDIDTSGVYICTDGELLGMNGYLPQVSDVRHDNVWFEIGELIRLLSKSNPTVLEALFVPNDKVIGSVHPIMQFLLDNREQFVSKQCFQPFFGYAKSQIEKARGLNKKIVNPVVEKLTPYDFIYTFRGQGSIKFRDWVESKGLKRRYCGVAKVANMPDVYGVYYDFGAHCANLEWKEDRLLLDFCKDFFDCSESDAISILGSQTSLGYRGVIDEEHSAGDIRLSEIGGKEYRPICYISYNQAAYSKHCRQYADYLRWIEERNEVRFLSNVDKNYDAKNMMHSFRMIHMAQEIARGEGMILERTWDHDFLMDIRAHKYEYEELISLLEEEKSKMNALMEASTIRECVDADFLNQLLIDIRKMQLKIK